MLAANGVFHYICGLSWNCPSRDVFVDAEPSSIVPSYNHVALSLTINNAIFEPFDRGYFTWGF